MAVINCITPRERRKVSMDTTPLFCRLVGRASRGGRKGRAAARRLESEAWIVYYTNVRERFFNRAFYEKMEGAAWPWLNHAFGAMEEKP